MTPCPDCLDGWRELARWVTVPLMHGRPAHVDALISLAPCTCPLGARRPGLPWDQVVERWRDAPDALRRKTGEAVIFAAAHLPERHRYPRATLERLREMRHRAEHPPIVPPTTREQRIEEVEGPGYVLEWQALLGADGAARRAEEEDRIRARG